MEANDYGSCTTLSAYYMYVMIIYILIHYTVSGCGHVSVQWRRLYAPYTYTCIVDPVCLCDMSRHNVCWLPSKIFPGPPLQFFPGIDKIEG